MPESIGTVNLHSEGRDEELRLQENWTADQQQQIIALTQKDSQICLLTDDPSRFSDQSTLETWLAKRKRFLYVLLDTSEHVVGSAWISAKRCENPHILETFGFTFAIRLYGKARGAGLAVPVLRMVFDHFMQTAAYQESSSPGFWLRTKVGNIPAYRTYAKFGFTTAEQDDQYVWMTWMPATT